MYRTHFCLGQKSRSEQEADFQPLTMQYLPEEERAWAGWLSDLHTLSYSHICTARLRSREAVMLLKQDNGRNIARGTATTIRICERGKTEKQKQQLGKRIMTGNLHGSGGKQHRYKQVQIIKMMTDCVICIFQNSWKSKYNAVLVSRNCTQSCILCVMVMLDKGLSTFSF